MTMPRRRFLAVTAGAAVSGCASLPGPTGSPKGEAALGIASAANPHVFPLLLAMALDPSLPVRFIPLRESADADPLFRSGDADAMLAMTYVGARKRASGAIPDLRLHSVTTWRGFFEVVGEGVRDFRDLRGKTVIVSGPMGSGRNGGGDIIFQAAARRQGVVPERDLLVEYMPARQGMARVMAGEASGITVPSPGSTGMILRSQMGGGLGSAKAGGTSRASSSRLGLIDFQRVFTGFPTFPAGQLPLGGLHASGRVMNSASGRARLERVAQAYLRAADLLMRDPGRHSLAMVADFQKYFAPLGAEAPPPILLARSVAAGDLVYRSDIPLAEIHSDLAAWLGELVGKAPESAFLRPIN